MSDTTNISWADSTWNPWRGCSKVSPGCKNCYAETLVNRFGGDFSKRVRSSPATFNAPLKWNKKPWVCDECGSFRDARGHKDSKPICRCGSTNDKSHKHRVFLGSLMDWLDPEVPIEWLADVLDIVRRCPGLDFLMLTKRLELWRHRLAEVEADYLNRSESAPLWNWIDQWMDGSPPNNIWLGVSVEDQKRADERIPTLLTIPATVRFVSAEPLLEHIQIEQYLLSDYDKAAHDNQLIVLLKGFNYAKLDWVIAGLESGLGRRDPGVGVITNGWDYKPGIAIQCSEYGTPFFCKQDCAIKPGQQGLIPDDVWRRKEFPIAITRT